MSSLAPGALLHVIRILTWCGAFAACACSSDGTSGGSAGMSATGGAGATAGASTVAGSGGVPSSAGASAAGAPNAGMGGLALGGAGTNAAGNAGSGGGTAGTNGGTGGSGGSTAGSGGTSGGTMDCAGHALSLSANGSGIDSDAAKARVEINLMSDLPIGSSSRTIELWAYMKSSDWTGNTNTLFFYGPFPSARNADGFGLDFGNTSGGIGSIDPFTNAYFDNDGQSSGIMVANSQWVHFAMTWDGTAVMAYVNGVLKSTKVSDNATQKVLKTGTSVFTIGGYPGENAYFADYIDEFRVWNVAHSAAQILASKDKTLVGNEPGLVGYWKFNESSGTTVADSVTAVGHTAHPGTLMAATGNGVPTFVVPNPPAPVSCP